MSKLLYDESPLVVNPTLAQTIGLNEAIVLQQIHYWLVINEKAEHNYRDGFYWTYNSYPQWQEQFPFWSKNTVIRTINRLEAKGLIITSNFNKMPQDKTKWYRIDYDAIPKLSSPSTQVDSLMPEWVDHKPDLVRPLPETTSETNPEITTESNSYLLNLYDQLIGNRTFMITVELDQLLERHAESQIADAIKLADKKGQRNLAYVRGILNNWSKGSKVKVR